MRCLILSHRSCSKHSVPGRRGLGPRIGPAGHAGVVETEASEVVGAGRYQCNPGRVMNATGRGPGGPSQTGDVELRIPNCGRGRSFPSSSNADAGLITLVCGGDGGLGERGVDPTGRRPRRRVGHRVRHLEIRSVSDLRRAGQAGRRVPGPALHHTTFPYVSLDATLCTSAAPDAAAPAVGLGWAVRSPHGRRRRHGRHRRRRSGDPRPGRRRFQGRSVLARFLRTLKQRRLHGVRLVISD